jgi:hypothetical protein
MVDLDVAHLVREDDSSAVAVEAVIGDGAVELLGRGFRQRRAIEDQTVEEAVPIGAELDESTSPDCFILQGLGIEAGGHLAVLAQSDADSFRHGRASPSEDSGEDVAEVGPVPSAVAPGLLVLISPVAQFPAVEAREGGQERRDFALFREEISLLGVEVIDPVAVDGKLPAREPFRVDRRSVKGELGRAVGHP